MTESPASSCQKAPSPWRGRLIGALLLAALGLLVSQPDADNINPATALVSSPVSTADSAVSANHSPAAARSPVVETALEVRRNDTLSKIFARAGVAASQLSFLLGSAEAAEPLKRLYPGERLVVHTRDDALVRIAYQSEPQRTWIVEPVENGFAGRWEHREFERRVATRQIVIENSLYESALAAKLSETTILQVAELFSWDIDFALDIRRGDQLALVFEELWLDGERIRDGEIIAAKFINAGQSYEALRFVRPNGTAAYFDQDGNSLQKKFLRSPVDFRRISSGFKAGRWHPVLGVKRPHRGVDYAASPGTPVKVTGDGKVVHVGNKGGYGRTVIIRHGQNTDTLYAHLKGYAKGLRAGQTVRQGEVIGFVGSSGLSTGPHLHYEFHVNGIHRNPLTVKLPDAAPLPAHERERFATETQIARNTLNLLLGSRIALH